MLKSSFESGTEKGDVGPTEGLNIGFLAGAAIIVLGGLAATLAVGAILVLAGPRRVV